MNQQQQLDALASLTLFSDLERPQIQAVALQQRQRVAAQAANQPRVTRQVGAARLATGGDRIQRAIETEKIVIVHGCVQSFRRFAKSAGWACMNRLY